MDYLAFVCGVYVIGCLIVVPLVLLSLTPLEYPDTLLWSVFACTILVAVIRTNGTVSLLRVSIAVLLSGIIIALYSHHPMYSNFLLSTVLSMLLLLVCGKVATTISRAQRGRMNGFGLAVLGFGAALFMWFVLGQLGGAIPSVLSLVGTIAGLATAIYGCNQAVRGHALDPRILRIVTPKRL